MSDESKLLLETSRFRVYRANQQLADGSLHPREIVRHPGSVVILPMTDDDRVCLIENYRIAVDQSLVELPAGTLDADEPPKQTAIRELAEETGFRAGRIELLSEFYISPGFLDERMHLYLATELERGQMALEKGEIIKPRVVPWSDALAMASDGRIKDAKTLLAIFLYECLRRRARQ